MGWPGTGRPGAARAAPPIGTPGCTGGGAGRSGALYTGRGPVCGTIMRGTGGAAAGGETGRAAIGAAGGALAEITGGAAAGGTCAAGGGITGRAGGALTGAEVTGDDAAGGATTGRAGTAGLAPCALTGAAAGGVAGLIAGGAATAGLSAGACVTGGAAGRATTGAASFFCVIALSTSPGREMCDKSIFVLISSSPRSPRELDLPAGDEPSAEERMYTRTFSASCSSRELECVFFSVTPTSGSVSRIALLLTSSSRARSLIRTLLIRPFVSPRFS